MLSFWDFIEIGTSDFNTEIEKKDNKKGLSIEALKYYLDKLPDKEGCIKVNNAVSNYDGIITIYYVPEDNIIKYDLPSWVRGCNSINKHHKNVLTMLNERGLNIDSLTSTYDVKCTTLIKLMDLYSSSGVYYLKIDTEGHDTVILEHFLKNVKNNAYLPHKLLFESNNLTPKDQKRKIITLAASLGYEVEYSKYDTMLNLNLHKLRNKSMFSEKISNYVINRYPENYDPSNPPHENTLEDAQKYCIDNNLSGVTYKDGKYEVRAGKYLRYDDSKTYISWIFL